MDEYPEEFEDEDQPGDQTGLKASINSNARKQPVKKTE